MAGKGDRPRPVNRIKYDKGWARIEGKCSTCDWNCDGKCDIIDTYPCEYIEINY